MPCMAFAALWADAARSGSDEFRDSEPKAFRPTGSSSEPLESESESESESDEASFLICFVVSANNFGGQSENIELDFNAPSSSYPY